MPGGNVEIMLFCVTGKVSKRSAISGNSRILFSHELHDRRVLHSSPMDAGSQVTPRALILHYVIANPCSAITFQCAQWSKLMSHFYSGGTRLPTISFFSSSWEVQFILKKIVMTASVRLCCEMKMCFVLSVLFFCLILWDEWAPYISVCVSSFIQLLWGTPEVLWLLYISLLHLSMVAWCPKYERYSS